MPPEGPQQPDYNFIVNPTPPPKRSFLGDASLLKRILLIVGGVLILIILFTIIKGIFGGESDVDLYLGVAQDQQQIIHIATAANTVQSLSTVSKNSAVTTQAGISSDQTATLKYMKNNGKKVKPKDLNLKVSTSIDEQLNAAAEAGTYDQTYKSVMEQQLDAYARHLKQTYNQTNGAKGHALLTNNYKSAKLLLQQLQTP